MSQLYTEKYTKDSKSPWLVFLHGFGGSTKMWKKQIDFFKEKYNLFFIDLPGHGKSKTGISGKKIKNFEDVGEMIVETLKENGIIKASFMCVSLGSLIFAGILSKHPEIVDSAILCGAISGINGFCQGLLNFTNKIKFMLPYTTILAFFAYVLMPFKNHSKSRKFFIDSGKLLGREEFIAWFNLIMKDMNVLKDLKNIKKNILFITGNEDFVFISGVKRKYEELKNSKLKILNHCGHVCNIQKAQEFNNVALNYLKAKE